MDMVGFGMSPSVSAPHTIEAMAAGSLALLDALQVDVAFVLGHHTGAAVAQELAVQAPHRVAALILSAMPWVDETTRAGGHVAAVDDAPATEDGSHLLELWRQRLPYYPSGRPDLLNRFIRDALTPGLDPTDGHRAVNRYEMEKRIGAVTAPVLILVPSEDPFAVEALPSVKAALTGTSLIEVRSVQGGHIPAMEQCAEQVAGHVRDFLAGVG